MILSVMVESKAWFYQSWRTLKRYSACHVLSVMLEIFAGMMIMIIKCTSTLVN